jgi:hypothetical protein
MLSDRWHTCFRLVAAIAIAAGPLLVAMAAESNSSQALDTSESLLVGAWESDLLSDLGQAWPGGGTIAPGQRTRDIIELRADRRVAVYPRCVEHHDGIEHYLEGLKLRWSVDPDHVLHWHSDPLGTDILGATVSLKSDGKTLELPGKGTSKGLTFERYGGQIPPQACKIPNN